MAELVFQNKRANSQAVDVRQRKAALQDGRGSGLSGKLLDNRTAQLAGKPNNTGLPDNLKSGIESLSGMAMDNVRVHYNSPRPAQLNAHAYAQGTNIHVAPGQEKHLPHEAWHVVQQAQGRVKPTMQMKRGVPVNDDRRLEREADVMGGRALAADAGAVQFKSMDEFGFSDMNYSVMSHEQYGNWKGTLQGKFDLHAATAFDGRLIVTQFKNPAEIIQLAGFFSGGIRGGLLILEGALTIAGGVAGITLSGGVGIVPGALAVVAGVVKVVRGFVTWHATTPPSSKELAIMDILRTIEAASALLGGGLTLNVPAILFGVAKTLRSLITALTDYMGNETSSPLARKGLMALATALHYLEVGAGIAGAVGLGGKAHAAAKATDKGLYIGMSATTSAVATSKIGRATDQAKVTHDFKVPDAVVHPV